MYSVDVKFFSRFWNRWSGGGIQLFQGCHDTITEWTAAARLDNSWRPGMVSKRKAEYISLFETPNWQHTNWDWHLIVSWGGQLESFQWDNIQGSLGRYEVDKSRYKRGYKAAFSHRHNAQHLQWFVQQSQLIIGNHKNNLLSNFT